MARISGSDGGSRHLWPGTCQLRIQLEEFDRTLHDIITVEELNEVYPKLEDKTSAC